MKSIIGSIILLVGLFLGGFYIYQQIYSNYQYDNTVLSYWNIADKTSTISEKSNYIDQFVSALQSNNLQGLNANLIFKTPDQSFDQNFVALQSLQSRLKQISTMDESSFQYQTAIQQITAQEQGQADDMLNVFWQCWQQKNYYYIWNPITSLVWFIGSILLVVGGGIILFAD